MPERIEKDHWHPGFLGVMEIEFREYRHALIFDDEHSLSKEPLKMDLLIIRKDKDAILQLSISANREIYEELKRRDPIMCEALRDLMKEEIQEERQEAADIALIAAIKNAMKTFGLDGVLVYLKKIRSDMPQNYKRGNRATFGPPCCLEIYFNAV